MDRCRKELHTATCTTVNQLKNRTNRSEDPRTAVTKGLMGKSTIQQLSSSGDAPKNRRAHLKTEREEREKLEKEAKEAKEAEELEEATVRSEEATG